MNIEDAKLTEKELLGLVGYVSFTSSGRQKYGGIADAATAKALRFFDTWAEEQYKLEYVEGDAHQERVAQALAMVASMWRGILAAAGHEAPKAEA